MDLLYILEAMPPNDVFNGLNVGRGKGEIKVASQMFVLCTRVESKHFLRWIKLRIRGEFGN